MSHAGTSSAPLHRPLFPGVGLAVTKIAQAFAQCPFCGTEYSYTITDQAGKKKEAPKTCGMLPCGKKAGEEWAK